MSKIITNETYYSNIASVIRSRLSVSTVYKPSEMADAIGEIITEDTHYDVIPFTADHNGSFKPPYGVAYSPVTVSVDNEIDVSEETFTQNGTYEAAAGAAFNPVVVSVPIHEYTIDALSVTSNGTYTPAQDHLYDPITVSVPYPSMSTLHVSANGTHQAPSGTLYSEVIASVPTDDNTMLDELVKHRFAYDYSNSSIRSIRPGAFYQNLGGSHIQSFPNVWWIGAYAFYNAYKGNEISFPYCARIEDYAFCYASIVTASLPECTWLGGRCFASCSQLTSVYAPSLAYIGSGAFDLDSNLSSITLGACETIENMAFAYCSALTEIDISTCTYIADYAFAGCINLSSVLLTQCHYLGFGAFEGCKKLSEAIFYNCDTIDDGAFFGCYSLWSVYLYMDHVPGLGGSSVFTSTPIAGYSTSYGNYGSIYVPESLIEEYQNAPYWDTYSNRFVAIS